MTVNNAAEHIKQQAGCSRAGARLAAPARRKALLAVLVRGKVQQRGGDGAQHGARQAQVHVPRALSHGREVSLGQAGDHGLTMRSTAPVGRLHVWWALPRAVALVEPHGWRMRGSTRTRKQTAVSG